MGSTQRYGDMVSEEQLAALEELKERDLMTATAFRVKELLHWVRNAGVEQISKKSVSPRRCLGAHKV